MAFQYQYQYQYQYGYQVQPGYQTYMSFFQMLHDVPLRPVLLSAVLAALPFALYYAWRRGYLQQIVAAIVAVRAALSAYLWRRDVDGRVREEYALLTEKKTEFGDVLSSSYYPAIALLGLLIVKRMLFFGLVLTGSMLPTLEPADLVLIESLSKDINVGDIIMFKPPGVEMLMIHRARGLVGDGVLTEGDASGPDTWSVTKRYILGKAVMIGGKPVVVKNIGWYFMPRKVYIPGSDPLFETVRAGVQWIHEFGPVVVAVLILFTLIANIEMRNSKKLRYG